MASDSNMPWASLGTNKPVGKGAPNAKGRSTTKRLDIRSYSRLAAYVAIVGLFWSLLSSPAPKYQPYFPEPSSRAEHDELSSDHGQAPSPQSQPDISDDILDTIVKNKTLGFEKIFVINLPERTDKRDAMSLTAALTDLELTWTRAMRGTSIPDKALPLGVDREGWRDGGIGSWRSQMNVIRT